MATTNIEPFPHIASDASGADYLRHFANYGPEKVIVIAVINDQYCYTGRDNEGKELPLSEAVGIMEKIKWEMMERTWRPDQE